MEPPEKPAPGECCGSDCVVCVYDTYLEELERYRRWLSEGGSQPSSDPTSHEPPK